MKDDYIEESSIEALFIKENKVNLISQEVLATLRTEFRRFKYLSLVNCKEQKEKLYY